MTKKVDFKDPFTLSISRHTFGRYKSLPRLRIQMQLQWQVQNCIAKLHM
jgi:hypothetical protein